MAPRRTAVTPAASGVLLLATLCLVGACAAAPPPGGEPIASPATTSAPPSALSPEDLVVPGAGRDTVLTGTVRAGVEQGCLVLQASGVVHQLVGATQGLAPGQRVTVHGRPDPGLLTTCQQGTPFVVTTSSPS